MLPANPSLPSDTALRLADQSELRRLCKDIAQIDSSFRSRRNGKQIFIKAETLRARLGAIRDGRGEEWWTRGKDMAERYDRESPADPPTPTPHTPEPIPAPVPDQGNASDKGQQLLALLASLPAGVNESAVRAIVSEMLANDRLTRPEPKPAGYTVRIETAGKPTVSVSGVLPPWFERAVKLASIRQHIMLVGPSGCGKTHVASKVAEAIGLPFYFSSCSGGMSEGVLTGRLLPTGEHGRFEYSCSEFVRAYEQGGVFLLDEFDAIDPNVAIIVNSAIANGHFSVPNRVENPVAKRHADFVLISAANTYGHGPDRVYAGRNQLDGATLDRFKAGMIVCGYSAEVETALVDAEVLAWGLSIRKVIDDNKLRRVMSTRVMLDFTRQKAIGLSRSDWEASYFSDWSADDRGMIR